MASHTLSPPRVAAAGGAQRRGEVWLEQLYPPRACPRCKCTVHAKRSRAGDKVYWGCFRHGPPTWCGLPIALPAHHLQLLNDYQQLQEQSAEELISSLLSSLSLSQPPPPPPPGPPFASPSTSASAADESALCKVCFSGPVDCVLLPCAHMALCVTCAAQLDKCPLCRADITARIRPIRG